MPNWQVCTLSRKMSRRRFKTSLLHVIIYLGYFNLLTVSVSCEEPVESDVDDALISQLLEVPVPETMADSDVSRILKILAAGDQVSTTTTTPRSSWASSTIPTTTTTQKPSPFFQTERPPSPTSNSLQRLEEVDDQLNSIISTLIKEVEDLNMTKSEWMMLSNNDTTTPMRRSDSSHFPPIENLLWSSARAVWDVSKPLFYKTKAGRKVSLIHDTVTLPLRTYGHIKHKIWDLTSGHYHPHGRKRSLTHFHDNHHGWGWGDPVYVKYEPENSLFKSWLRFLYRAIRPAVIGKIRFKKLLIRIKIRFLWKLITLLKTVKIQKVFTALSAVSTKLQLLKARLRPNLVVLKETGHAHGWGWHTPPPPPPPPPPPSTPPPTPGWAWAASSSPEVSYGPPAHSSYGKSSSSSWQGYGHPPPSERPSPVAYNQENTYNNYYAPPSRDLVAPSEQYPQASEDSPHQEEAPSYAKFLREFGINPSTLSSSSTSDSGQGSIRSFRDIKSKPEDVPYLTTEDEAGEDSKAGRNL